MTRQWTPRLLLALGSGLALALAFPSYDFSLFAWVSLGGLMLASLGARPRQAALFGFLQGVVFYAVCLPWIYTVLRVHGGAAVAAAAGVLALLVAALSLYPMAFSLGVAWLSRASVARACVAAPFLWTALEYGRTYFLRTGFPWNLLGYAAADNLALLQLASLAGIYGLSFLLAAYNALFAWVFSGSARPRTRPVAIFLATTAALLIVIQIVGRLVPVQQPQHVAHLVQTNFPQSLFYPADWMNRHAPELDELERLSIAAAEKSPGLVIWPEAPAPFSLQDPQFAARAQQIARASRSSFLLGVDDWKPRPDAPGPGARRSLAPYNSAALLDPLGREVFLYDKIHLVPFGEYVPLRRWLTFARKLTSEIGDFQSGSEYKVHPLPPVSGSREAMGPSQASPDGGTFGVFICYEAIFPAEVRRFVANGAGVLINLSNDGWFGHSAAPAQHLAMARVRAVENRRWLLRATNNGYTVAIDPYGRFAARLAPDVRGVLEAPYDFRSDLTGYARWGDWLAWLCVLVTLYFLIRAVGQGVASRPKGRR